MVHLSSTLFSVLLIILIEILIDIAGPFIGAIIASAPTGTSIALYYAASANEDSTSESLIKATEGLSLGALCTLFFALAARQAAQNGLSLFPTLITGYFAWGFSYLILGKYLFSPSSSSN
jgi:hypothetical protein